MKQRTDTSNSHLHVEIAQSDADLRAAQALRYQVFVRELGANGSKMDTQRELEIDRFDADAVHLLLRDTGHNDAVVGVYRLIIGENDQTEYSSEVEFDLTKLRQSGKRLLELSRSCLDADYRGGRGMFLLWQALAEYIQTHNIDVLFGVASFHGTDALALAQPLVWLQRNHLANSDLRPVSRLPISLTADVDDRAALLQVPALIKAYLRMGGRVGDGAFIDDDFNTIDVCMVLDMADVNPRQLNLYAKERR